MVVKVYFESDSHAELTAIFDNEAMYMVCAKALEKAAKKAGMIVTESVQDEIDITDLKASEEPQKQKSEVSWRSTYALISHRVIEASEKSGTEAARLRGNNGQLYLFDYIEQLTNQFEESHVDFDWEDNDFYDVIETFLNGKI